MNDTDESLFAWDGKLIGLAFNAK
jgi:hypothetical protein